MVDRFQNAVVDLLASVCESLDIPYDLQDTEEGTEVIVHAGDQFLDYLASKKFTTRSAYRRLQRSVNQSELRCLVDNLKSLVDDWRRFIDAGELRILVD